MKKKWMAKWKPPMATVCPIECMRELNPPDWLEKHHGFVLTLVATASGGLGLLLSYFLKSRCHKISCGCISCDRDVIELQPKDVEVTAASA